MSHWYERDGTPKYEVQRASGNGTRSTTLRDARKLALVPSVTTVLSVISAPGLENWKINQGIMAALTFPNPDGLEGEELLKAIRKDGREQAIEAAKRGTAIHDAIEASFKGEPIPEGFEGWVSRAHDALADLFPGVNDWVAEEYFASRLGFGGKCDLYSPSTGIVIDWKTKDGDLSGRLGWEQNRQLAAYQVGLGLTLTEGHNIFLSRDDDRIWASHNWSEQEMFDGWHIFHAALSLWKLINGYDGGWNE